MSALPIKLLDNQATDVVGDATGQEGGFLHVVCEGDFGGGTVTLQTSHEGSDWQDVYASDGTLLEINAANNYASTLKLRSSLLIRATLAGATAASITVKLV